MWWRKLIPALFFAAMFPGMPAVASPASPAHPVTAENYRIYYTQLLNLNFRIAHLYADVRDYASAEKATPHLALLFRKCEAKEQEWANFPSPPPAELRQELAPDYQRYQRLFNQCRELSRKESMRLFLADYDSSERLKRQAMDHAAKLADPNILKNSSEYLEINKIVNELAAREKAMNAAINRIRDKETADRNAPELMRMFDSWVKLKNQLHKYSRKDETLALTILMGVPERKSWNEQAATPMKKWLDHNFYGSPALYALILKITEYKNNLSH